MGFLNTYKRPHLTLVVRSLLLVMPAQKTENLNLGEGKKAFCFHENEENCAFSCQMYKRRRLEEVGRVR